MAGIRQETSDLNVSKGGSTSLYVDQNSDTASDNNDGYSWDRPYASIMAAINDARPWTELWIKTGLYKENVIIPHQNIKMHGLIQDGTDRVVISPDSGIPLVLDAGHCEVNGIALESHDNHVIKANYPGQKLHDLYLELNNATVITYAALWLNDSDYSVIRDSYLTGLGNANVIGVRVDGGSVDNGILGNYITGFGAGAAVGYAVGLDDAQRCAILPSEINGMPIPNRFVDNYVGVYFYARAGYRGHAVIHNLFAQNDNFDMYDNNVPTTSGIVLRENCYAYTGWMEDRDHSGRADIIVNAYGNYDHLPLSSPWSWVTAAISRLSVT